MHPALIWPLALCCLCLLLYLCTFRSYLKGVNGSIAQRIVAIPPPALGSKAHLHSAIAVFVIDVEANLAQSNVYVGSPTLNYEAIVLAEKPKRRAGSVSLRTDSLSNLLFCDENTSSA
ncbi:uncharacterized protein LOC129771158 [Toxorhynchites rutilus septentrionalis]|uniref:uncharacterized protein LOC129771158 n=1 Tax=Toxorhynchites rutilus septentrionalis TaxID=329112 RepID=UPI0024791385|nr:uncharacterized protein LOC129771158 [Toxorhynchites rutilus septentrionalis]